MKKTVITILLSSFAILSYAQNKQTTIRKGFVFGTSIGISNSIQSFPNKSQTDIDFGLDLKLGYMIKPTLAILLTSNISGYEYFRYR